jgi:hypothetical protein
MGGRLVAIYLLVNVLNIYADDADDVDDVDDVDNVDDVDDVGDVGDVGDADLAKTLLPTSTLTARAPIEFPNFELNSIRYESNRVELGLINSIRIESN